jgi:hypothetical protein
VKYAFPWCEGCPALERSFCVENQEEKTPKEEKTITGVNRRSDAVQQGATRRVIYLWAVLSFCVFVINALKINDTADHQSQPGGFGQ